VSAVDDGASPLQGAAITATRAGADALNDTIRTRLQQAGQLGDDQPVGGRIFAVGELVMVTRNDHQRSLLNGARGTVTTITEKAVRLQLEDGRNVDVPAGWAADRLRPAYALTIHKAQGLTVDVALVDTTGINDRNAGYVAASRARHRTDLHHTDMTDLTDALGHDPLTRPRARTATDEHTTRLLATRLQQQRQNRLASEQLQPRRDHRRDLGRGR
jgi:ATP-dependent exoDNAse (exonuclease V) alpha subunit